LGINGSKVTVIVGHKLETPSWRPRRESNAKKSHTMRLSIVRTYVFAGSFRCKVKLTAPSFRPNQSLDAAVTLALLQYLEPICWWKWSLGL